MSRISTFYGFEQHVARQANALRGSNRSWHEPRIELAPKHDGAATHAEHDDVRAKRQRDPKMKSNDDTPRA
jgi:uncharacterized protein YhdP